MQNLCDHQLIDKRLVYDKIRLEGDVMENVYKTVPRIVRSKSTQEFLDKHGPQPPVNSAAYKVELEKVKRVRALFDSVKK